MFTVITFSAELCFDNVQDALEVARRLRQRQRRHVQIEDQRGILHSIEELEALTS